MRFLILFLVLTAGCASHKPVKTIIPKQCLRVKLTDFTKPCKTISEGLAVCDGVIIHVDCTQVVKE